MKELLIDIQHRIITLFMRETPIEIVTGYVLAMLLNYTKWYQEYEHVLERVVCILATNL